jgi:sRNA-binding regulator protein Hfq
MNDSFTDTGGKNMQTDPQTMTQEAFDNLPEAQQQFYRALIEKGQLVITTPAPTEIPPEEPPKKPALKKYPTPFSQFRDEPVVVTLTCGPMLTGILSQIWQYEIIITDTAGEKILVMKHAIVTLQRGPKNAP